MNKFINRASLIIALMLLLTLVSCSHKHSYDEKITTHTCTDQGYTTHTCECGDSYIDSYVEPSHNWGEWVVVEESTPQQNGVMERQCKDCGAIESTMDK